jgi:putative ABC transport system permease protein
MMISVTERTGDRCRKALGATSRVILWQFLVEAVTLTAIGAIAGLVSDGSLLSSFAMPRRSMRRCPGAIVAALLASCFTGVIFGMVPARRRRDSIRLKRLRYE